MDIESAAVAAFAGVWVSCVGPHTEREAQQVPAKGEELRIHRIQLHVQGLSTI